MKIKIEGYTGPNTVIGNGGKVRARLAVNAAHPAVGEEVEVDESETGKPSEAELEKLASLKAGAKAESKAAGEKVPDSAPNGKK